MHFRARTTTALLGVLALAGLAPSLRAQGRLIRRFTADDGLLSPVLALAQDGTGFLWIGTTAGLLRYDGAEFRRWAPEGIPHAVGTLAVSPSGSVAAVDGDGRVLELTAGGARLIGQGARRSPDAFGVAAFDRAGRLWVARDSALAWRDPDGAWHALPRGDLGGLPPRHVLGPSGPDAVLVSAPSGLWSVAAGRAPRRVLDDSLVVDAEDEGGGIVVALTVDGRLLRADSTGVRDLTGRLVPSARAIAFARRGNTYWVDFDRYLVAVVPGSAPEVLGPRAGTMGAGPLLVDREGSLWLGGFTTLSQYPEPDTRVWTDRQGLPSAHTRNLARSGDVLWVTTWQGTGYLRRSDGAWHAGTISDWLARDAFCTAAGGAVWLGTFQGLERLDDERSTTLLPDEHAVFAPGCAPASDGGAWIPSSRGLLHATRDARHVTAVPFPIASPDGWVQALLRDRHGRLWAASGERICAATEARALALRPDWSCQALPRGTNALTGLVEMPGGDIWASSHDTGVLCYRAGRWTGARGDSALPTRSVLALLPARTRGVWIVGEGMVERVVERPEGCRWDVLEELGLWQGLPAIGGGDLLEEADGTVWIASSAGVVRVPAHVRNAAPTAPRVAVVDARVDGRPVPLDRPLVLPYDRNRLELRFAALTYRDPSRVRYQVRVSDRAPWVDTQGRPTFYWVDLPAGRYEAEVRASLDGRTWSRAPAVLAFRVLPPWYRSAWALSLFAGLAGALGLVLYHARLAYLLGLERQRTRIAMDLHDEMGSGLASIGILASVLAGDEDDDADARALVAREMAATAGELGSALSDIVWALDPHAATLEELAGRLAEHGGRLFADDVDFDTDFPAAWPAQPLPLALRRNLLLIGLEALHNAARHASARRVVLELRREGRRWELVVRDDGVGLGAGDPSTRGSGRGLRAMRQRAAEVGGRIAWERPPAGGTAVRVEFRLPGRRARLREWLDRRLRRGAVVRRSHDHATAPEPAASHPRVRRRHAPPDRGP